MAGSARIHTRNEWRAGGGGKCEKYIYFCIRLESGIHREREKESSLTSSERKVRKVPYIKKREKRHLVLFRDGAASTYFQFETTGHTAGSDKVRKFITQNSGWVAARNEEMCTIQLIFTSINFSILPSSDAIMRMLSNLSRLALSLLSWWTRVSFNL